MEGLKYGEPELGNISRYVYWMDMSGRQYLEMDVTGPIIRTLLLNDPRHREEQETWIPLSMD